MDILIKVADASPYAAFLFLSFWLVTRVKNKDIKIIKEVHENSLTEIRKTNETMIELIKSMPRII